MTKSTDRKIELIQAILKILETYSPEELSVTILNQYISFSRATLYRMFSTRENLLDFLHRAIKDEFISIYNFNNKHLGHEHFTQNLCSHIIKYRNYYKWQLKDSLFIESLSLELRDVLFKVYRDKDYALFASYGTVGYIVHWVRSGFEKSPIDAANGLITIGQNNCRAYHSQ